MGAIAKGVGSLFGGRARRREQKSANKEFAGAKKVLQILNLMIIMLV